MSLRVLAATLVLTPAIGLSQTLQPPAPIAQSGGNAGSSTVANTGSTPGTGKIVMYRGSSVFGAGVACPIRYKGHEVVELARGKFAEWVVPPGRYILNNHTSSVEVAVDPGETRYIRCMIKMGMLAGRADLQVVDEESFNEHRNQYELKPLIEVPAIPPSGASAPEH